MDTLVKFIKEFSPNISDTELKIIVDKFEIITFKKNTYFLKANKTCKQFAIIKKGCFKVIYASNRNVWFAFENMPITEMQSFINQSPSQFVIQAIEPSEVYVIDYAEMQKLYEQLDSFKLFGLKVTEKILAKTINRSTALQFETPEMLYKKLIENTDYLTRISLQDIASYLGITPNSLSRIRNRMMH
jgi:CRP-like cAMP-binding protein